MRDDLMSSRQHHPDCGFFHFEDHLCDCHVVPMAKLKKRITELEDRFVPLQEWHRFGKDGGDDETFYRFPDGTEYQGKLYGATYE